MAEPLTVDTITNAQIRALQESLWGKGPDMKIERMRWACSCALGDPSYYDDARLSARARCAEIINERVKIDDRFAIMLVAL